MWDCYINELINVAKQQMQLQQINIKQTKRENNISWISFSSFLFLLLSLLHHQEKEEEEEEKEDCLHNIWVSIISLSEQLKLLYIFVCLNIIFTFFFHLFLIAFCMFWNYILIESEFSHWICLNSLDVNLKCIVRVSLCACYKMSAVNKY